MIHFRNQETKYDTGLKELYDFGSDDDNEETEKTDLQKTVKVRPDENDQSDAESSATSESCFRCVQKTTQLTCVITSGGTHDLLCLCSEELSDGIEESDSEEAEEIPTTDATNRIAVMNLDWDHVSAVDILAVLQV